MPPRRDRRQMVHHHAVLRRTTLLVIDELGYLPLPAEAASPLFQVVCQRYLKTSTVITTNLGVGSWGEILGDTTVAAAMLDRLLHRPSCSTSTATATASATTTPNETPAAPPPAPANPYTDHAHRWGISMSTPGEFR